jgi:hypothetical protein
MEDEEKERRDMHLMGENDFYLYLCAVPQLHWRSCSSGV